MYVSFRYFFVLIVVLIFMSSCASIFNSKSINITVKTNKAATIIYKNQEYSGHYAMFNTMRSDKDLKITVIADSVSKTITVPWKYSGAFLWADLFMFPVPHLVDWLISGDDKIYTYDSEIYIDMTDSIDEYSKFDFWKEQKKNRFLLTLPEGNIFQQNIHELGRTKRGSGFLGLGAIYEYQYDDKTYLSLTTELAIDLFMPLPIGPIDVAVDGDYDSFSCAYVDVRNNHEISQQFSFGYGLSLTNFRNRTRTRMDQVDPWSAPEFIEKDYINLAAGLSFAAKLRLTNKVAIGLVYNPSLISFSGGPVFSYSHFASFRLLFNMFEK